MTHSLPSNFPNDYNPKERPTSASINKIVDVIKGSSNNNSNGSVALNSGSSGNSIAFDERSNRPPIWAMLTFMHIQFPIAPVNPNIAPGIEHNAMICYGSDSEEFGLRWRQRAFPVFSWVEITGDESIDFNRVSVNKAPPPDPNFGGGGSGPPMPTMCGQATYYWYDGKWAVMMTCMDSTCVSDPPTEDGAYMYEFRTVDCKEKPVNPGSNTGNLPMFSPFFGTPDIDYRDPNETRYIDASKNDFLRGSCYPEKTSFAHPSVNQGNIRRNPAYPVNGYLTSGTLNGMIVQLYYGRGDYMLFETSYAYTFGSDTALGPLPRHDFEQPYLPYDDMTDYDRP